MNREDIIAMAREAGLFIAYDSEGHFSGVVDSEMLDMYPDKNKERDRLNREQRFVEILTPFAALVASAEREACATVCDEFPDVGYIDNKLTSDYHSYLIRKRGQA